eukprot:1147628-Pelagomonas_calceolata.AAC.1
MANPIPMLHAIFFFKTSNAHRKTNTMHHELSWWRTMRGACMQSWTHQVRLDWQLEKSPAPPA